MNHKLLSILFVVLLVIDIGIAYAITIPLGIQNEILFQSYTAMNYTITYEVIIWFALALVEAFILDKKEQGTY